MKLEPQDRLVIEDLRFDTKIKKVYIRYTIILMLDDGFTYQPIGTILGINEKMVQRVVKLFEETGIDGLATFYYKGRSGELSPVQIKQLKRELQKHFYKDTKEIQVWIQDRFHIRLTRSAISMMLKRIGFVYKKTKVLPGKTHAL